MFISLIDVLRKNTQITTQELADKAGVSRQALHKARSNEGIAQCRLSTLARIASALGVSTKDLYEEVKEEFSLF